MGKSDPNVFRFYSDRLPKRNYDTCAFLGFSGENNFTKTISAKNRSFYDLSLGNWNINDIDWQILGHYDLIICTRCPYFAKDPKVFVEKCMALLNPGGIALLDWGLGDHWRFENYKVGWVKDGEHEYAYDDHNYLWSCIWDKSFEKHSQVSLYTNRIKKFGYHDLTSAVENEVPSILRLNDIPCNKIEIDFLTIWEDQPQLYICLTLEKN